MASEVALAPLTPSGCMSHLCRNSRKIYLDGQVPLRAKKLQSMINTWKHAWQAHCQAIIRGTIIALNPCIKPVTNIGIHYASNFMASINPPSDTVHASATAGV